MKAEEGGMIDVTIAESFLNTHDTRCIDILSQRFSLAW